MAPSGTAFLLSAQLVAAMAIAVGAADFFDCKYDPCQNGGLCQLVDSEVGLRRCLCPEGFRGQACEVQAVPCGTSYCAHGGVCGRGGRCECPSGLTGPTCETAVVACPDTLNSKNMYCLNGGECSSVADSDSTSCVCKAGFAGSHCEDRITECFGSMYCVSGNGLCSLDGASCECRDGFTGQHCESAILSAEKPSVPVALVAVMSVLGAGVVTMASILFVMYRRERSGNPLFEALLEKDNNNDGDVKRGDDASSARNSSEMTSASSRDTV